MAVAPVQFRHYLNPMSRHVINVGDRDFEQAVLERSKQVPIVVDFWAPWCGPCRSLGPLLERLVEEHDGAFLLAKVNIDENPEVARAFRVQSIPMVLGFRDGKIMAQFVGAVPEAAVREFLQRLLPTQAERLVAQAQGDLAAGKIENAKSLLRKALEIDSRCDSARIELAALLREADQTDEALALLERVAPGPWRSAADRLMAEIRVSAGGGDIQQLQQAVHDRPNDLDARFALAQALGAQGQYDEALGQYLEIVRRNRAFNDGAARKAMIEIFELLGPGSDSVDRFRSELAKVLFS